MLADPPLPIAFYPFNEASGAKEASPDSLPSGKASNLSLEEGPRGKANGSYFFNGSFDSYVLLPNTGELDIKYVITIITWIFPEVIPAPILTYKNGLGLYLSTSGTLVAKFIFKDRSTPELLETTAIPLFTWSYVAVWYNYYTGLAGLFIGNKTVVSRDVGSKRQISTGSDIKIGSSFTDNRHFKGRISGVQFYDEAMTDKQIRYVKQLEKGMCS